MKFLEAFAELMKAEGGYSDDPQDPGNWSSGVIGKGELMGTKYGIAANSYSHLDIKNLTKEQAKEIYQRDYWDIWQFEGLTAPLPDTFLYELFDASVNAGKGNARRFLQRALGVADDGKIGQVTIEALDAKLKEFGVARVEQWFIGECLDHYTNLTRMWGRYGRGWAKRIAMRLRNM